MVIHKQSCYIEDMYGQKITPELGVLAMKAIEKKGRNCYRSGDLITEDSYKKFLKNIMNRNHYSVIEHCSVSAFIVTNKAIETETVRHRLSSFSISSTRYCNFSKDKYGSEIHVVEPFEGLSEDEDWLAAVEASEKAYLKLLEKGYTTDKVRGVLPLDVKSDIWMTTNLRNWRHYFEMRCTPAAHFQIREIAMSLLEQFYEAFPPIFEDLYDKFIRKTDEDK